MAPRRRAGKQATVHFPMILAGFQFQLNSPKEALRMLGFLREDMAQFLDEATLREAVMPLAVKHLRR